MQQPDAASSEGVPNEESSQDTSRRFVLSEEALKSYKTQIQSIYHEVGKRFNFDAPNEDTLTPAKAQNNYDILGKLLKSVRSDRFLEWGLENAQTELIMAIRMLDKTAGRDGEAYSSNYRQYQRALVNCGSYLRKCLDYLEGQVSHGQGSQASGGRSPSSTLSVTSQSRQNALPFQDATAEMLPNYVNLAQTEEKPLSQAVMAASYSDNDDLDRLLTDFNAYLKRIRKSFSCLPAELKGNSIQNKLYDLFKKLKAKNLYEDFVHWLIEEYPGSKVIIPGSEPSQK